MYIEFHKYLFDKGRAWIANVFTKIIAIAKLPKIWRKCKVIALLKPDETAEDHKTYRPKSTLCTAYLLLECELLSPVIDAENKETFEAGFVRRKMDIASCFYMIQRELTLLLSKSAINRIFVHLCLICSF